MRPTLNLSAKGFLGRSLDELQRWFTMVLNAEGIRTPNKPYILTSFDKPEFVEDCKKMSDQDIGGFSIAKFDWVPASTNSNPSPSENIHGHAKFHGSISIKLPVNRPEVQRTGYAGWRTKERGYTIFGKSLWDIDAYAFLALRIKSDGRKYFVNLQTESLVHTDIHQHRLYAKRPGEWETVLIPWTEFVRTNHGTVVEPQGELLRQSVRTIGIGLTDRIPGNFELCIEKMWATNSIAEKLKAQSQEVENLGAKNDGKIRWNEDHFEKS
ncbi:hypothetical protein K3495_g14549 [Podosphaera aphanis]|nr:hypothetical protein K3495_g14549 [Podosphaera aphanis]